MKHVDVKYNFNRDEDAKEEVKIIKATNEQIADIMTKGFKDF